MRKLFFLLGLCCSLFSVAQTADGDSVVQVLRAELAYNLSQLRQRPVPAYFMSLRLADIRSASVSSTLGAATASTSRQRMVTPQIRIGSPQLDNYKYVNQGSGAQPGQRNVQGEPVPIEGLTLPALRQAVWNETLRRYQIAVTQYEQARSKMLTGTDNEDQAPCFSAAPVEQYYEAPLDARTGDIDLEAWKQRLNQVSAVFLQCPDIDDGKLDLDVETTRNYLVNSDGTTVVQNRHSARIIMSASIKAVDGMVCPLYQDYFALSVDRLPDVATLRSDALRLIERLKALRTAPVADPYTGPALLSGPASGVFFHEIFGHRLEGHRMKSGGQTFKKMVGERVLPATFQVRCDPTIHSYGGRDLNGGYAYDDEGVRARRVDCVRDGVLSEFLMSRVPLDGFPVSNGHGRTSGGNDPVSRQSNLIVETTQPYTSQQLRDMLIAEARRQGKDYGYYFTTVRNGYTLTGEGGSLNSFNVTPLEVYRVFTDGRPDQLVRGVDLIGTPLSMFSNIVAAGDESSTFIGQCGAESGWVPVSASSPMIFVSKVETQRKQKDNVSPKVLPAPAVAEAVGGSESDIIFRAMTDEMERSMTQLAYPGYPAPCFVNYTLGRIRQHYVSASLGGILFESTVPVVTRGSVNVSVGSPAHLSDTQQGQLLPVDFSEQVSYDNIRRQLWGATDQMYKYALNAMAQKQTFLAATPMPQEETAVPDMLSLQPCELVDGDAADEPAPDKAFYARLAQQLSLVLADYPELYRTRVDINNMDNDTYRVTSEGIRRKTRTGFAEIVVSATVRTRDGQEYNDKYVTTCQRNTRWDADALRQTVRQFADRLMAISRAEALTDYYIGPMMFEGDIVAYSFSDQVVSPLLLARRSLQDNSGVGSLLVGKRMLDRKISIRQLASLNGAQGVPLLGSVTADANGVAPAADLTLVRNGFMTRLLCGRYPALNSLESTGNDRFVDNPEKAVTSSCAPGVLQVTIDGAKPLGKLMSVLCRQAASAGLQWTYVVRQPSGFTPSLYRVNVRTGEETLVRVSEMPMPDKTQLLHVLTSSKEQNELNTLFNNVGCSFVTPRAIIVDDMEYAFKKPKAESQLPVVNPALRQ